MDNTKIFAQLYEQSTYRNSRGFASDLAGDNFHTGLQSIPSVATL